MVAAESDKAGLLDERGGSGPATQFSEGGRHLGDSQSVIHGRDGDVTAVNDPRPVGVGVEVCTVVEAHEVGLPT